MVPEIKYYVPSELVDEFESRVSDLPGTWLISTRNVKSDSVIRQSENPQLYGLAQKMRNTISHLPGDTLLEDLRSWTYAVSFAKNKEAQPLTVEWADFLETLSSNQRSTITRAFNTLSRIGYNQRSLGELSYINWNRFENSVILGMGEKGKYLIRKTFEGLTFSESQLNGHGTGI